MCLHTNNYFQICFFFLSGFPRMAAHPPSAIGSWDNILAKSKIYGDHPSVNILRGDLVFESLVDEYEATPENFLEIGVGHKIPGEKYAYFTLGHESSPDDQNGDKVVYTYYLYYRLSESGIIYVSLKTDDADGKRYTVAKFE